jgi:hypothetical protein
LSNPRVYELAKELGVPSRSSARAEGVVMGRKPRLSMTLIPSVEWV